jgi:hypothetical protein
MLEPIPPAFLVERTAISMPELRWAFDNGIVGAQAATDIATAMLVAGSTDPIVIELAGLSHEDLPSAKGLLERVPVPHDEEADIKRKWVWLILLWVYERHHEESGVFQMLEGLYADLGYPEEMEAFGPYAPAHQIVDTPAGTRGALLREWRRVLASGQEEFGFGGETSSL